MLITVKEKYWYGDENRAVKEITLNDFLDGALSEHPSDDLGTVEKIEDQTRRLREFTLSLVDILIEKGLVSGEELIPLVQHRYFEHLPDQE